MWIFTKYGFFSVVCARQGKGEKGQPVDPDRLMIRARLREHLERLLKRFPQELGEVNIHESRATDYAFRIFVPKETWQAVICTMTEEMDYDNFKDEVGRHQGKEGRAYKYALSGVWEEMLRLQDDSLYGPSPHLHGSTPSPYTRLPQNLLHPRSGPLGPKEDLLLGSGDGTVYNRMEMDDFAAIREVEQVRAVKAGKKGKKK